MKVLTIGRDLETIHTLLRQEGLEIVEDHSDVVLTYGGDGRLLEAERLYPGIPKLAIRHNSICKMCVDHDMAHTIKALAQGSLSQTEIPKLEVVEAGKHIQALNEISVHHVKPNQAIRFSVQINDEEYIERIIGDGVIIATPFGSHAYYRSITNSTFRVGIGIAFNNSTEPVDHTVIRDNDAVHITILRGPAFVIADNDPSMPELEENGRVTIKQSKDKAIILGLNRFRCPDCGMVQSNQVESGIR